MDFFDNCTPVMTQKSREIMYNVKIMPVKTLYYTLFFLIEKLFFLNSYSFLELKNKLTLVDNF